MGTSPLEGVTSVPFDHMTLINLYISSHREATEATLFQIFCDNKIKQILQEKQNALVVTDLLPGSCICTWNKLIKAKATSPLNFFFEFFF